MPSYEHDRYTHLPKLRLDCLDLFSKDLEPQRYHFWAFWCCSSLSFLLRLCCFWLLLGCFLLLFLSLFAALAFLRAHVSSRKLLSWIEASQAPASGWTWDVQSNTTVHSFYLFMCMLEMWPFCAHLIFQQNSRHGLTLDQSMTNIMLKNQGVHF